jgi:hypothetical protein
LKSDEEVGYVIEVEANEPKLGAVRPGDLEPESRLRLGPARNGLDLHELFAGAGLLPPAIERRGMNAQCAMGAGTVELGSEREDPTPQGRRERSAWLPPAPGPNVMLN